MANTHLTQVCVPFWAALLALTFATTGCKTDDTGTTVCDPTLETDTGIVETVETDTVTDVDDVEDIDDTTAETDTRVPQVCPWERYDDGLIGGPMGNVQFDPRQSGLVYASAGSQLFRSNDAGASWQLYAQGDRGLGRLAFPSDDIKKIYSASASGVLESTDSGNEFRLKALGGLGVLSLAVHSAAPQRVFVGTDAAGVLRSNDQGQSFVARNVGVKRGRIQAIITDPRDPNIVHVGTIGQSDTLGYLPDGQILRTIDGGDSWTAIVEATGWVEEMVTCPANPDVLYAGTKRGMLRSDDGGATWSTPAAFANVYVYNVDVSHTDCDVVYAMGFQSGMYRSDDGGVTAQGPFVDGLNLQISRMRAASLAVDPENHDRIFAATHAGLSLSEDGAQTWDLQVLAEGITITNLSSASPSSPQTYLGTWGSGLWSRDDEADEWHRETALPQDFVYSVHPDPYDPDSVFVGGIDLLFRSVDNGDTYEPLLDGRGNILDAAFTGTPGEVFVATQVHGILRSLDGGVTFEALNGDIEPWPTPAGTFIDTRALVLDASNPDRLVAGTHLKGIMKTDDGGVSWRFVGGVLGGESIMQIRHDPGPPERLFALVQNRGTFVSEDWGDTWVSTGGSLLSLELRDFDLDTNTGHLYLTLAGDAVYTSRDGGATWDAFDRYCIPGEGFSALAIIELDKQRYLLAGRGENQIWRHAIGNAPE